MTRRLATMCCMAMVLIGISSSSVSAQTYSSATLKGIGAVRVVVEALPDGAKVLGLSREAIQTDVELKLSHVPDS
jgi:hypothetical protein